MSKIDLEQLKIEIQSLNRHKQLYKVLKEELSKRGWWKTSHVVILKKRIK